MTPPATRGRLVRPLPSTRLEAGLSTRLGAGDVLLFAVLAAATLFPLWRAPDWPANHEFAAFAIRTDIYARHFSWFDVAPIWTSIDVSGFGSPMPLMYHKLFYFVAAPLALAMGSTKSALIIVLAVFLVVGAAGMQLTLRALSASRVAAIAAGCCLTTANYTITNWLIRGAMAELSAAMLVPWVFLAFVKTIQQGRITVGLGVAFGLLWLSHSAMAFYTGLLLGVTYVALAAVGAASWSVLRPTTAWPALLWCLLLVLPYLIPMTMLSGDYEFSRFPSPPLRPLYQYRPALSYLWDTHWRFGRTSMGLTMQLDLAMLGLAAVGLGALVGGRLRTTRDSVLRQVLPFGIVAALGLALQLFVFRAFYEWVPGAAYIQFPWRLLALVTPALIVGALYLADQALPSWRTFVIIGATVWMVAACGAFRPMHYPRVTLTPSLADLTFSGFREYEPRAALPLAETQARLAARWAELGCSYVAVDASDRESAVRRFWTRCMQGALLPLPLYSSPLHAVDSGDAPSHECLPVPDFPSLCGVAIPAGETTVRVRMPTMAAFARWMWRGLWPRSG